MLRNIQQGSGDYYFAGKAGRQGKKIGGATTAGVTLAAAGGDTVDFVAKKGGNAEVKQAAWSLPTSGRGNQPEANPPFADGPLVPGMAAVFTAGKLKTVTF